MTETPTTPVLARLEPRSRIALPVVFDSPHSGRAYPEDFGYAAPFELLRRAEDAFVDELFSAGPEHGAGLLCALFPRSYIDPNRHESDLDLSLIEGAWPHPVQPTERTAQGLGLIRRLLGGRVEIYDRKLSPAEVEGRIAAYHRPYHEALAEMLDGARRRFGAVWHLNCHSMRATGRAGLDGRSHARPDFVLGDRDGASCEAAFTQFVAETLRDLGYSVSLNRPFKGAELVSRHGAPSDRRHSLQVEVNRGLYLDERNMEKTSGFAALKTDIDLLIARVCDYARRALR